MARKVILVTDPGLDGAFAVALALIDPNLEVLGIAASAGNVSAAQATRNVQILVEQLDPSRWPRLGAALPVDYGMDATNLHGPGGLGGIDFPTAELHHRHPSDKLITDLVRQYPHEVSLLVMAPATALARTLDRDPELVRLIDRVILVGGCWREPGDISAVSEYHFYCDPVSARDLLRRGLPITLLPLDITRQLVFSPGDLMQLPNEDHPMGRFLRRIAPPGIRAAASLSGTEGIHLQDVLAPLVISHPELISIRPVYADVETRGELTRGMSVMDLRWGIPHRPNVDLAVSLDVASAQRLIQRRLMGSS